mgnify:FL=1
MARQPVMFPKLYPSLVVIATLDVLLTAVILDLLDGIELNPIAAWIIAAGGMVAASYFKFAIVAFTLWACEFVGRRNDRIGKRLIVYAVSLNCVPVTAAVAQLAAFAHGV